MRARVGYENEELVKELGEKTALLIYDIPYPPKASRKELAPWFSWYDWATSKLRALGYPIQYSVVLIDEKNIPLVKQIVVQIDEKRQSLNKAFGFNIPEPHISVVRFRVEDKESAEALFLLVKAILMESLKTFIEHVEEQLREGRDKTKLQKRVREFLSRLRKQDFLNLLLRDPELRRLALQLEILTA
ncbi:MAG: hypothetical protein DRJ52_05670 [Thermoprotei archaeon]|nr:MAG: hypothetical protein DRJ52_05670 [Thermoprotei archaeon]